MQKQLYFICPTDYLERVIDNTFQQEKYYYTSLGNSITFDVDTVGQLSELLEAKNISNISFALAYDNRIIRDAVAQQDYSKVSGLKEIYIRIVKQQKQAKHSWQTADRQFLTLSYHLNSKINELKQVLSDTRFSPLPINAIIYSRQLQQFSDIYPDLVCREAVSLN